MLAVLSHAGTEDSRKISGVVSKWLVETLIVAPTSGLIWMLGGMMSWNPTVYCFDNSSCELTAGVDALYGYVSDLLLPLGIVAMMFTAMFFVSKSGSPRGRARARKMLYRLIIGMLLTIYSPMIYQGMIDISSRITQFYLSQVDMNRVTSIMTWGKATTMCSLMCCVGLAVVVSFIILGTRWFYVYFYALFFPMIIFLYFFEMTKPYGSKYLKEAIKWIFVPALQAMILYILVVGPLTTLGSVSGTGAESGIADLLGQITGFFVILGGLVTMCAAPLIMTSLMEFLGTAVYSVGLATDNLPLMSMGGVIRGQGPAAFTAAHAHFSRSRAYESAQANLEGLGIPKAGTAGFRAVGGEVGPIEGRGGSGGEALGGGDRATGGGGMPAVAPTIGGELSKARSGGTTGGRQPTGDVKRQSQREKEYEEERLPEEKGERGATVEELLAARDEARLTGFTTEELKEEREGVAGRTGLLDELSGRRVATPLSDFASLPVQTQSKEIEGMRENVMAIKAIGKGALTDEDIAPLNRIVNSMREIHRLTNVMQTTPDTLGGNETTVMKSTSEQKNMADMARIAKEKLALWEKNLGRETHARGEIEALKARLESITALGASTSKGKQK